MKDDGHKFVCTSLFEFGRAMAASAGDSPVCFVCSRYPKWASDGLKYKGLAVCLSCAPFAFQRYAMTSSDLNTAERESVLEGGRAGGHYLSQLEKTDLSDLSEAEWENFLVKILGGYVDGMRRRASEAPPF